MKASGFIFPEQTAQAFLLLTAGMLAILGMAGLINREQAEEQTAESPAFEIDAPLSEEVFSVLPEEISTEVFAGFQAPLTGKITSRYGYRSDPFTGETKYHRGVDIAVPAGTEVRAAAGGTVTVSAYGSVGGNYVIIAHENGTQSYYGHLQTRTVSKGDFVKQGQIIGLSGATGKVTGAHLHFQLTYRDRTVDPQKYVDLTP